jgi:hypothetical protein
MPSYRLSKNAETSRRSIGAILLSSCASSSESHCKAGKPRSITALRAWGNESGPGADSRQEQPRCATRGWMNKRKMRAVFCTSSCRSATSSNISYYFDWYLSRHAGASTVQCYAAVRYRYNRDAALVGQIIRVLVHEGRRIESEAPEDLAVSSLQHA